MRRLVMMSADVLLSLSPPSPDPDPDPLSSSQARSRPPPRNDASIRGVKPSENIKLRRSLMNLTKKYTNEMIINEFDKDAPIKDNH
jgi:hypothetical protein